MASTGDIETGFEYWAGVKGSGWIASFRSSEGRYSKRWQWRGALKRLPIPLEAVRIIGGWRPASSLQAKVASSAAGNVTNF